MSVRGTVGNAGGFTLVELLIVIAIVAILAGISIPSLTRYKMRAHDAVFQSDGGSAFIAAQLYLIDNPSGIVDSYAKLKYGGYSASPEIVFSSGDMTVVSGNVILVSTMADNNRNVSILYFNGNINIVAN